MTDERDSLDEVLEIKKEISSSFATYDDFAAWLLREQAEAKSRGIVFAAA